MTRTNPPPAEGQRLDWNDIPASVRAAIETWLGSPVVSVQSQRTGFSPGVAARLRTADHRRVFVKAAGLEPNPGVPAIHRQEGRIAALLPTSAPVPRLLWSYDDAETGWVVLAYEEIDGKLPAQPWRPDEFNRVLDSMAELSASLTPSPLPDGMVGTASEAFATRLCGWQNLLNDDPSIRSQLDDWSARNLDALAKLEADAPAAVDGNTLLHFDIRADNILLSSDKVWFVDWPLAVIGAAWVDVVFFAPSVAMQGGAAPEQIIKWYAGEQMADSHELTAAVAATAGFFIRNSLLPPPPGLPTLRAFQAAQGVVAREWLAERTGWM
jgi:aminoglycoside phosphotransferase (APT) family kinase protein